MSTIPIIDPEALENLKALNPDDGDGFLRELVEIFLSDTPARIVEMKTALSAGDGITFTRAAHSIKGSASNLGAEPLRAISEKLEHRSKTEGMNGIEPLVSELEVQYAAVHAELKRLVP